MRRRVLATLSQPSLCVMLLTILISSVSRFTSPLAAEIIPVNPLATPAVTLPPAEASKLRTLLGTAFPSLQSDISPDDRVVITFAGPLGPVLLDVQTGATARIPIPFFSYRRFTELRWRDPQTAVYVGADVAAGAMQLVSLNRGNGAVEARPLTLPGFPVSLSANGQRLLIGRVVGAAPSGAAPSADRPSSSDALPATSPFVERSLTAFKRPGPVVFDRDDRMTVQVTTTAVELAVVELATLEERVLLRVPLGTGLLSVSWSPDDAKLALVLWEFPDNTRGGTVPTDSATVQDSLGRLHPRKNPFFARNIMHLFALEGPTVERVDLKPSLGDGQIFARAVWAPDARRLIVEMWEPSFIEGRPQPVYSSTQRSTWRVYSSQGRRLSALARREVETPFNVFFMNDDEVVIQTAWELSFHFYVYHLRSHTLRRLPTPAGTIYQSRAARRSGELVYGYSSFQQPYELYKISTSAIGPTALTHLNGAASAVNQIRVDAVRFQLPGSEHDRRGGRDDARLVRTGFLIQPKGASFPPRHVPLIVWQQGGPTAPMTQEWGSFVEQPFNILPNFGFAVLVVPLPGRLGFGPAFLNALADGKNFGQIDIDEQAEIARQLVDRGFTLPSRLGITGCSYGGYFASQSITRHPNTYAAANPQCSLLDLVNEYELGYKGSVSYLMGRTPAEDPAEYTRDSPVLNASRVKTPTLIFAGVRDFLPYQISQRFHDAINAAGTLSDFYVFDREGHGLAFPNSQFVAGQAQIDWFRNHLGHD